MPATPKTIAIVCHYYPPHLGGIEMVAKQQAERLAAEGHRVTVVTSQVSDDEQTGTHNGVNVVRVKAWNGLEERGAPFPVPAARLWRTLREIISQSDMVHIHDTTYIPCVAASIIARLQHKPVVVTQHVGIVQHPSVLVMLAQKAMHSLFGAGVLRRSRAVLTLNDRVERHVLDRGVRPARVQPLANGVDTGLFYPATRQQKQELRKKFGLSQTKPIVLFVGRFVPKKGFDKVIAARDDAYQLVFAGGQADPFTDDRTVMLGTLPQTDLAELYRAADIFVLPSQGEGFPLSIQEAMATGLPVVAAHDEGYARYGLDANLVTLLHRPSEHSIRAALKAIIADGHKQSAMAMYSREYALAHFSWERVMATLNQTYDRVLQEAA